MRLEEITPCAQVTGITCDAAVTVVATTWIGGNAMRLSYRTTEGKLDERLMLRAGAGRRAGPGRHIALRRPPALRRGAGQHVSTFSTTRVVTVQVPSNGCTRA